MNSVLTDDKLSYIVKHEYFDTILNIFKSDKYIVFKIVFPDEEYVHECRYNKIEDCFQNNTLWEYKRLTNGRYDSFDYKIGSIVIEKIERLFRCPINSIIDTIKKDIR